MRDLALASWAVVLASFSATSLSSAAVAAVVEEVEPAVDSK